MLCERCKIREANIQYTELINGVKTEHNYCIQCAKELDFGPYSAIFDGEFPLGKLLSGLLGISGGPKESMGSQVVCPTCKTSYEEFVRDSRFGCADCYGVFDLLIKDNIRQLQGSESHKGKQPKNYTKIRGGKKDVSELFGETPAEENTSAGEEAPERELEILSAKLQEALKQEEYEMAAVYRDRIRALKEEMDG